jgi:16S rRNA C967 or C1407 C5-methylase (RsmB/RsmF family)
VSPLAFFLEIKSCGLAQIMHIRLQLRILQRAMRMLQYDSNASTDKPRIVYSTCSLNPVENEAVIAAALNSVPGSHLDPFALGSN